MGDLVRLVIEIMQLLWPFRMVEQWENGALYACGRYWKTLGPGTYPVVPWFMVMRTANMVPAILGTGRQDITLKDGKVLSFAATATVKVIDVALAFNSIDNYHETTQELMASFLAEQLAEVDADRLSPEKRSRFFTTLEKKLADQTAKYGVELTNLRFTSFVLNARTYPLLMDTNAIANW